MLLDSLLSDEPDAPSEYSLVRVSRRAMATTFEVALPVGAHPDPIAAAEDALDLVDELEDQLTVYRDHSAVARLNAAAAAVPVQVEPRLFALFARCAVWTRETAGAFDIATGALTRAWGFCSRSGAVPGAGELVRAMRAAGFRHVVLDEVRRTVKFRVAGLELNLGAVGKGYALDRAAELLRTKWGVRSALLSGGGSSVYAIGRPPGDAGGWPVRLKHPSEPDRALGTVRLCDAGLGTSASTFQFFEYNGRKLGHLLDPRTGWPVADTASASVVAPTAAEADAMSTAAFVLGAAGAERLTRLRPALGAVVLSEVEAQKRPTPQPPPYREGVNSGNASWDPPDGAAVRRSYPPLPAGRGGGGVGLPDAVREPSASWQDASPIALFSYNLAPEVYSPPAPHGPVHADRHP
jgi:thiamine biosynthesis lipoprotein